MTKEQRYSPELMEMERRLEEYKKWCQENGLEFREDCPMALDYMQHGELPFGDKTFGEMAKEALEENRQRRKKE